MKNFNAGDAASKARASFGQDVKTRLENTGALEKKGIDRRDFDFARDIDALVKEDPGAIGALVHHVNQQLPASSPVERLQRTLAVVAKLVPADTHQLAFKAINDRVHDALTTRQQQLGELQGFFGTGKVDAIKAAPEQEVIDGVSGTQAFMAALMSGASHEDWLAHGTEWIATLDPTDTHGKTAVRGEDLKSIFASDVASDGASVSGRTTAKPTDVLLKEIDAAQDTAGKQNGRIALLKAHQGMHVAGQAVAHLLMGKEAPTNIGNIQRAAWGNRYPNPLNADRNPVPFLSAATKEATMSWGRAATNAIAEHEAGGVSDKEAFWEQHPLAEQAARTAHMAWVRMDDMSPEPMGVKKNFEDLSLDQQMENLRKFAMASYGMVQTDAFFRNELGDEKMVSNALKGSVRESAQAAMTLGQDARNFGDASRMQYEAVRTQALVSMKKIAEDNPDLNLDVEKLLTAASPILDKAVQEAVERYDGAPGNSKIGASSASIVGDEFVPELLAALSKSFGTEFTKDRIVGGSSIESLQSALQLIGIEVGGKPGEILERIGVAKVDNWGIDAFMKMATTSDPPLTKQEAGALLMTLLLFNATWMTQQHIRAMDDEAGGKDDNRVKQDLVQWFVTVLSEKAGEAVDGQNPGEEAAFVLGQDLMEAKAKAGLLSE